MLIRTFIALSGILVAVVISPGCASSSKSEAKSSLVRAWSLELKRTEPMPYPFVAEFRSGKKNLHYLAINHENWKSSKSFRLIREVFRKQVSDIVLMEGFENSQEINPKRMVIAAKSDGKNSFYKWGETTFAIQEAVRRNIPFVGGEPDESEILSGVTSHGYSARDLLYFYFVRQIPQMQRDQTLTEISIESSFNRFISKTMKRLRMLEKEPSFEEFKTWYFEKNKQPFFLSNIDSEASAPLADGEMFTQRISSHVGQVRDEFVIQRVRELLLNHDRVLMIYGGSHFVCQQHALEALLGKARSFSTVGNQTITK